MIKNYDDAVIELIGAPSGWNKALSSGSIKDYGANGSAIGGVVGAVGGNDIANPNSGIF